MRGLNDQRLREPCVVQFEQGLKAEGHAEGQGAERWGVQAQESGLERQAKECGFCPGGRLLGAIKVPLDRLVVTVSTKIDTMKEKRGIG